MSGGATKSYSFRSLHHGCVTKSEHSQRIDYLCVLSRDMTSLPTQRATSHLPFFWRCVTNTEQPSGSFART
jgi:hypothetical protein